MQKQKTYKVELTLKTYDDAEKIKKAIASMINTVHVLESIRIEQIQQINNKKSNPSE